MYYLAPAAKNKIFLLINQFLGKVLIHFYFLYQRSLNTTI